jgi:hypothetical protein
MVNDFFVDIFLFPIWLRIKRALLRAVPQEVGGVKGIRVYLSQLVFGAVFAL